VPELDDEAISTLLSYPWPGNVRELKNVMQQLSLLCDGKIIRKKDLPVFFYDPQFRLIENRTGDTGASTTDGVGLKELKDQAWEEIERHEIQEALNLFDNNRTRAAEYLGISRRTLQTKIKKYGL